jgi:hypothetical protein
MMLWVLRLWNTGRSGWRALLGTATSALALTANNRLTMLEAKFGPHRIPGYGTERTLQNAILPDLVVSVGSALALVTLIIGLLPTKPDQNTKSRS